MTRFLGATLNFSDGDSNLERIFHHRCCRCRKKYAMPDATCVFYFIYSGLLYLRLSVQHLRFEARSTSSHYSREIRSNDAHIYFFRLHVSTVRTSRCDRIAKNDRRSLRCYSTLTLLVAPRIVSVIDVSTL